MSPQPHSLLSGRYRLIDPIGEGGMGRVWHARDELLHREVAVKEITPEGLTRTELGDLRERAIREARAIAQISHPGVVRIFDVVDDEAPWIVMELVRSRSLHQVIAQDGPLAPREAARIGLGVLAGLRAAHQRGILHRDVKPANVLLADDGRVLLTDFGLAMMSGDSSMTRTGVVLGSPSYLAPERALDEPADAKADLWSLGATLYAAIDGRPPYLKSSPMATLSALMTQPPPVSERAGALQPVLAALLRRNPAERADADEAEHLLRKAWEGTPEQTTIAATRPLTPSPRSRRRWLIPVVAAAILAGGVALAQPFKDATRPGTAAPPAPGLSAAAPVTGSSSAAARPSATKTGTTRTGTPSAAAAPAASAPSAPPATRTAVAVVSPPPPVAAVGGTIRNHGTGTCLQLPGPGGEIQLWQCDGSDRQRFHFAVDGTLRVLGQCVELGSAASGSRMRAATCSGSTLQQFTLNAARDLVSPPADMCVDVPDWNAGNGVAAQIWSCAGTDNQKWN
ncbi:protein kinase [Actinoplanes sp. NPDC048796]|uniref:protein kinase domain-containing protein n=1 Tax=Actinoplanes sp. NPDC048796 TaxID=3155640 RepID=UPI0033DF1C6C